MTRASESPLIQAERRSWKYWSEDGIPLIISGLICLALAGSVLLLWDHPRAQLLMLIPFFLGMLLLMKVRPVAEWFKARYVWPRTGYVAAPFFADMTSPVPPDVLSIRLERQPERELQQLRRRHQLRQTLTAGLVAALLPQAASRAGLFGVPVVWIGLGVSAAAVLAGLYRFLRFLHHHPQERA